MAAKEKFAVIPPLQFAPIGLALIENLREGLVVFDPDGKLLFTNEEGQRILGNGDGDGHADDLLPRLAAMGARIAPLRVQNAQAGVAAFIPPKGERPRTLAERERQAIIDTLDATQGKLAETARRLGISRTTLWRRLKAYGLKHKTEAQWQARSA